MVQQVELTESDLLVWNRQKIQPEVPFFFPRRTVNSRDGLTQCKRLSNRSLSFLASEWHAIYHFLVTVFERSVVNDPIAVARNASKLVQQAHAVAAGFRIPPSIITNDRSEMLNFLQYYPKAIIKRNGIMQIAKSDRADGFVASSIMTMVVTNGRIKSTPAEQFRLVPSFVQRKIEKAFELRVVAIEDSLFAFKIPSQNHKITSTDWRYGNHFLKFEPYEMDECLRASIRNFMKRTDLFTGSIDLIVDKDRSVWFLEVNQSGAWAWLDPLVDGRISSAFASAFAKHVGVPERC